MKLWKLDAVHDNNGDSTWVDLVMVVTTMIMMMMMMMKILIDGHKPGDNVDLAESRDVNCVSKIDDNAGGHYNGDHDDSSRGDGGVKGTDDVDKGDNYFIDSGDDGNCNNNDADECDDENDGNDDSDLDDRVVRAGQRRNSSLFPTPSFELFALASNIVRP